MTSITKTMMMKKTLFAAAVVAAFTFSACSEKSAENTEAATAADVPAQVTAATVVVETPDYAHVAAPLKTQVAQLVEDYMALKDALVADDASAAKAAASNVLATAKAMPIATLTTDEKTYAEEKTAAVISTAEQIAAADDIAAQRTNLQQLSEPVFAMAKAFGATEAPLYYQHCPMARDGEGGYWLSSTEEIRNPYFGSDMIGCGSTQEVYND